MPHWVERHMRQIEVYLDNNPQAADTAEGILHWWINDPKKNLRSVEQALEALARQGRLVKQNTASGEAVYSRTRDACASARSEH